MAFPAAQELFPVMVHHQATARHHQDMACRQDMVRLLDNSGLPEDNTHLQMPSSVRQDSRGNSSRCPAR